ncbi:MAG: phosphoenolpyruvate--protein phosphotransferase [Bacillota bacterium]
MKIKAIIASPGMAVAPALVFNLPRQADPEQTVTSGLIGAELDRFTKAHSRLYAIYTENCARLERTSKKLQAEVLSIQQMMLMDKQFTDSIRENIGRGYSAEAAVQRESDSRSSFFESLDDPYFKDRAYDVKDLCQRLICELRGEQYHDLAVLSREVIVVAKDIPPSVMSTIDIDNVKGIATMTGGKTSHTAILAANMQIPAVVGCGDALSEIAGGVPVFVNGITGEVETGFDEARLKVIAAEIEGYQSRQARLKEYASKKTITKDGRKISLFANIMGAKSGDKLLAVGAEGVGLFRTEFLFMDRKVAPGEDEQYEVYSAVAAKLAGLPVIIRTMDIGGDKEAECLSLEREDNPFLGYRAIRISLDRPELFITQLKACLRASADGNVMIMLPMISGIDEVNKAKDLLEQAKESLRKEQKKFNDNISVGIMIEVPAAAIMADELIKRVDFFSIGSNDLTQYTLAVDRLNPKVSHIYDHFSPAVIRLIHKAASAANNAGKLCGLCGEMAGDPLAVPLLIGLGVKELSVNPVSLLQTRKIISEIDMAAAEAMASKALQCDSSREVTRVIKEYFGKICDEYGR